MHIDTNFWNGRRVFITGHTGFKGSWLCLMMHRLGARVTGYSLPPPTDPSLFEAANIQELIEHHVGDIREFEEIKSVMENADPEIVIHMAAQPLVREAYDKPLETYETNVMGTAHLLQAARGCANLGAIIVVTTDKCYENKELGRPFSEDDPIGGYDPYSASKACAEIVAASYRDSFYSSEGTAAIATVRAGNVIGGGDFAKDRIVPDIIRAWQAGEPVVLRNPQAIRPWQDVLEPLGGYIVLAERLAADGNAYAGAYNFGPPLEHCREVSYIAGELCTILGGRWEHDGTPQPHEASSLRLSSDKAHTILGWHSKYSLDETLEHIAAFTTQMASGGGTRDICNNHIEEYLRRIMEEQLR